VFVDVILASYSFDLMSFLSSCIQLDCIASFDKVISIHNNFLCWLVHITNINDEVSGKE